MRRRCFFALSFILMIALAFSGCQVPVANEATEHDEDAMKTGLFATTVYYDGGAGLLVPVERSVPLDTDIPQQTLSLLVASVDNTAGLSGAGLTPTLPEGVSFAVETASGGTATVDVREMPQLTDKDAEQTAVTSIVNTMLRCDGVKHVQLTFDGETLETLPFGTLVGEPFSELIQNPEDLPAIAAGTTLYPVTLWYKTAASGFYVPVTRYLTSQANLARTIEELLKTTSAYEVSPCFPEGTQLESATLMNGVATLTFTEPFLALTAEDSQEAFAAACDTLSLTCSQFGAVKKLVLESGGKVLTKEPILVSDSANPLS